MSGLQPEERSVVSESQRARDSSAESIEIESDTVRLSALYSQHESPRGMLVTLHGGGLHSGYFHGTAHPDVSLLTLGRALGYSVLALDRPGYGRSADAPDSVTTASGQAQAIWQALQNSFMVRDFGEGLFLVGHSFGSMVATDMAGTVPKGAPLAGLAISGVGTRYQPAVLETFELGAAAPKPDRRMHWGDEILYPAATFDSGVRPHAAMPSPEPVDARRWPELVASVASKIEVPVQLVLAESELNWNAGPSGLKELERLFTRAAFVETGIQRFASHNISLGWSARAYHLRVLAFAEDCLNRVRDAQPGSHGG